MYVRNLSLGSYVRNFSLGSYVLTGFVVILCERFMRIKVIYKGDVG